MKKQDQRHSARYRILEVQAWDERAGWLGDKDRRKASNVRSAIHIAAVMPSSKTTAVIVMLLAAAALMFVLV